MQVVAHHRQAQAGSNLGLGRAFRQSGIDSGFHKHRATFAQFNGMFRRKRQRAVIGKRNAQARRLLFHETTRARRAHLVHLEIGHLASNQADVLRILPADFEHGVHLRVSRSGSARLCGNLVAYGIGSDELADHGAPAARHTRGHYTGAIAHALRQRGKPVAHGLLGVAARAQVLRVQQHAVSADKHKVCAGRSHVHAQRHWHGSTLFQRIHHRRARHRATFAGGRTLRVPRARSQRKTAVRRAINLRQPRQSRQVVGLRSLRSFKRRAQGGKRRKPRGRVTCRARSRSMQTRARACSNAFAIAPARAFRRQRRAHRLRAHKLLVREQFAFRQVKHLAHRTNHASVLQHAASQRHRLFNRQITHNSGLERLHRRMAQALQDILNRHALLLAVNDVSFGEHAATA